MKKQKYSFQKFQKKNSFFQKSFFHFLCWRSTKESTFDKYSFSSFLEKKEKKNLTKQSARLFLEKNEQKKSKRFSTFFSKAKKNQKIKKNVKMDQLKFLSSVEKFSLLFLKKRKIETENFLSNSSSFEIWQNFLFKSPKIGNFFPKKKNFMQYWIVPFLGVLFFISQNPFLFFVQKEEKRKKDFFSFPAYQIFQSNEIEQILLNSQTEKKQDSFIQLKQNQNPEILNFSFAEKNFLEFQTEMREKNESKQLLEFYTQIFKNSFSFSSSNISSASLFSVPKKLQTSESHKSSFLEEKKIFVDFNSKDFLFLKQNSKKIFEEKRNSFHWKWFSFSFLQKKENKLLSNVSYFEIPQKAEFFWENFSFLQNSEKNSKIFSEKSLTPLFDVSKSFFFFDELNRTFTFFPSSFSKREELNWKNEKNNFFASSFFLHNLKNEKTFKEKNRFFLQKWVKTQKFSLFSKNFLLKEDSLPFLSSFFSKEKKNKTRNQKNQRTKLKTFSKFESSFFENLSDFELLYLEKFFQKFNSKKFLENSFLFSVPRKNELKKMQKNKREVFDFLSFQHFHKKYKNFWRKSFSKRFEFETKNQKNKKDFQPVLKTLSLSLFKKEDEKNFLILEKSFFGNFFEKRKREISLKNPLLFHFQNKNDFQNFFPSFSSILPETFLNKTKGLAFQFQNSSLSEKIFSVQNSQFSFFPYPEKGNSFSFSFFCESKKGKEKNPLISEYEKKKDFQFFSSNIFFKKNWALFFNSQNFQQNFLFETNNLKTAFLFRKNLLKKDEKKLSVPHFEIQQREEKKFEVSQFQIQKKKKISSYFQQPYLFKAKYSGFSKKQKKFEKVLRAFFSPSKNFQNEVFSVSQRKETFHQKKTKKEAFFLENLSTFFKKNPELASVKYFLSTKKEKKFHEFRTKNRKKENSMRFLENFEKRQKRNRLSPELVLQRDGFLSFSSQFGKQNQNKKISWFNDSNRFLFSFVLLEKNTEKSFSFQRLEKEKDFQKKRRLKKEKLETRRRKKRKRFYPRPTWLTMNFYKKFLKTRHSPKEKQIPFHFDHSDFPFLLQSQKNSKKNEKKHFQNSSFISSLNIGKGKEKMKKYFFMKYQKMQNLNKKYDSQNFDGNALFLKNQNVNFQKKTYQKNFQTQLKNKKYFFEKTFLLFGFPGDNSFASQNLNFQRKQDPLFASNTELVSKNIENYKISNEMYQEFLSLSWKSSFFQKNLKPYTRTLRENFQKVQSIESQKNFSLKNKNFLFFFRDFPVFSEHSRNDFLIRKSVFQKFSWYTNVSNSFSLQGTMQNSSLFSFLLEPKKTLEKNTKVHEYNRILYARISEVFKKSKFLENMESGFFHENRRKNEKIFSESKNSFFTKSALFFEKLTVFTQPRIPAFSIFSSLFHDNSLKPTGDLATLRARWAFQKTNFSHFQEQNSVQNLWAFQKRKTLFCSLKGMKNIFTFFQKFQTPHSENSLFSSSFFDEQTPLFFIKEETLKDKKGDKKTLKKEKSIQNVSFFQEKKSKKTLRKKKSFSQFVALDNQSFQKFQNIEKKALLFGLQSFKEKKTFLRYSKYQIAFFFENQKNKKENKIVFENFPKKVLKNKNRQNSAKSSFQFWWDQQSFEIHDFRFLSMQLNEFKRTNSFSFFENEQTEEISQKSQNKRLFLQQQEKNNFSEFFFLSTISFSIFGAFFFHFSIFSSLFKIPEIRSVFKFTFLLFWKFWRSFFVVFFAISSLFQKYTRNSLDFFKKKKTKNVSFFFSSQGQTPFFWVQIIGKKKKNQKQKEVLAVFSSSLKRKKNDFLFEFFSRVSFFQTENIKKIQKKGQNTKNIQRGKTKKNELKRQKQKSFQSLSKVEKTLSQFALSLLLFGKKIFFLPYHLKTLASFFFTKIFEVIEGVFYGFYKFLEKPAEFMIESIAFVFFLEWSADMLVYFPDSIETSFWKSSQKLVRPVRAGVFVFPSGIFLFGLMKGIPQNFVFFQAGQNIPFLNSFQFFVSTSSFHFWNITSYILQKRLLALFEIFPSVLLQPEKDILVRQRNGIIFWDIWGEILLKAAEKYNVNLPSFATLKEEQELFVEKLVENTEFFKELKNPVASNHFQHSSLGDVSFLFSKNKKETKPSSFVFPLQVENSFFEKRLAFDLFKKFMSQKTFPYSFEESPSQFQKSNRWQCNQYSTFQSQESDFFLDISPPTSLKDVHFLKYYEPPHSTVGSLICEIYAGLFPKKIAKNILVVGESGSAKTFFLRALAGETEMKIITENASRYAMVQRGVAVGMKYLRDVFDALALQTPCFFVMEDLHLLGAKRPFLLSENESSKTQKNFSFGLEQEEVHERNQMIYQSSRHSISDFRRPYKGDFSMTLPSNFFLQTFYSPFFFGKKKRNFLFNQIEWTGDADSYLFSLQKNHIFENSQFLSGNFRSGSTALSSPLPIDSLLSSLNSSSAENTGIQEKEKTTSGSFLRKKNMKKIQSCLQFSKLEIFAPPATSPFPVFMMKEQKRLKPTKLVQELPKNQMGAFSADQILLSQKENTSVRAKISALAEKTMNLSRGKFDMITDFLVILDSVRSNRGFVVFGTTHKPSSLDPALRRPGRFDETLSLSRNPNFLNRFEILKMNFGNSVSFDFFDMALFTENFSEIDLFDILSQTKLSFFHSYKYSFEKSILGDFQSSQKDFFKKEEKITFPKNIRKKELYSQTSPSKAFHTLLKSSIFEDFYDLPFFAKQKKHREKSLFSLNSEQNFVERNFSSSENQSFSLLPFSSSSKYQKSRNLHFFPNRPSHMLSLVYSKLGVFLADSLLFQNPTSFRALHFDIQETAFKQSKFGEFYGTLFYGSKKERSLQLQVFFAGKISEFFASSVEKNDFSSSSSFVQKNEKNSSFFSTKFGIFVEKSDLEKNKNHMTSKQKAKEFFSTKMNLLFFKNKKNQSYSKNSSFSSLSEIKPANPFSLFNQKEVSWTVFGNDENWRFATPFLFSILQKRFLFTKNLLLSKMLFFENMDQRRKPPSPPASSLLIPAKKYENFKRTEFDFFEKKHFSINEKIQMHQKQRFLKQLYNVPVQESFCSEFRKNQKVHFRSAFQEFASLDSALQKSSSSHSYFKKYIQIRHRFSNINQWWNGMFPEHTRESTYLSDVDWRTMFLSTKDKKIAMVETSQNNSEIFENEKVSNQTFEFLMDFPDAEQYYNPRNRRWFFSSNVHFLSSFEKKRKSLYFPGWHFYEKDLQYEIFSHFFIESFYQSFSFFEEKREMLDFCAFHLLQKGFLKEFHFLTIFSRF